MNNICILCFEKGNFLLVIELLMMFEMMFMIIEFDIKLLYSIRINCYILCFGEEIKKKKKIYRFIFKLCCL